MASEELDLQLDALAMSVQRARSEEESVSDRVLKARRAGASWTQVGAALGVTRQSAWEKYRRLEQPAEV